MHRAFSATAAMMIGSGPSGAAPAPAAGGERRRHHPNVSVVCSGLPRPVRPVPSAAGPRPGTPRPGCPAGGATPSGRAEWNWWRAGARQAAAAPPSRQRREDLQGRQARGARAAHGEGEPGAGAAGARAERRTRVRPRRRRRACANEEVELPAGAQPAAQCVVALLAIPRLAAAAAVVIGFLDSPSRK
ncbi:translation initiation factor IF-2-like [Panicum virgatum]|uniref:translation initiation factor IF-2-like n=1 Tax=Panicum virgatum TaxID=38727 RepID=UPI0019D52B26|nr:translation initiation factor IF-2-like [Panicum virgatum]